MLQITAYCDYSDSNGEAQKIWYTNPDLSKIQRYPEWREDFFNDHALVRFQLIHEGKNIGEPFSDELYYMTARLLASGIMVNERQPVVIIKASTQPLVLLLQADDEAISARGDVIVSCFRHYSSTLNSPLLALNNHPDKIYIDRYRVNWQQWIKATLELGLAISRLPALLGWTIDEVKESSEDFEQAITYLQTLKVMTSGYYSS